MVSHIFPQRIDRPAVAVTLVCGVESSVSNSVLYVMQLLSSALIESMFNKPDSRVMIHIFVLKVCFNVRHLHFFGCDMAILMMDVQLTNCNSFVWNENVVVPK